MRNKKKELRAYALDELDQYVPEKSDLFLVDEHFGLPIGMTFKVVCCHGDPTLLNEKLSELGIVLGNWGMLPKSQRPQWQELMKKLGVGKEYWQDPDLLFPTVPYDAIEDLDVSDSNAVSG